MKNKRFYVYRIDQYDSGEFYIGSRGCIGDPNEDIYYIGSMHVWNPNLEKITKTILHEVESREKAYKLEAELIKECINDPLNRNYHIPNCRFNTTGMLTVKNAEGKFMLVNKDDARIISGELVHFSTGMMVVKDASGNYIQTSVDDPRRVSGELHGVLFNRIMTKDANGNNFSVYNTDPRYLSGELKPITKGYTVAKDMDGNLLQISVDDPRLSSGELVGMNKGKAPYKDKNGNTFLADVNDPRIVSNEIVSTSAGKLIVKDKSGKNFSVLLTDPRYLSGELVHRNTITNEDFSKKYSFIPVNELDISVKKLMKKYHVSSTVIYKLRQLSNFHKII